MDVGAGQFIILVLSLSSCRISQPSSSPHPQQQGELSSTIPANSAAMSKGWGWLFCFHSLRIHSPLLNTITIMASSTVFPRGGARPALQNVTAGVGELDGGGQLSHSCDLSARILPFCYVEDRCHIIIRTFISPSGDIYVVRSWRPIPSTDTKLPGMLVNSSHGHSSAEVQIAHSQD